MAQEKNPAPKKSFMEQWQEEQDEFDRKHPILDTRYFVEEWRKAYTPWFDPYDDEVPAKLVSTFGPFDAEKYREFMDRYEPTVKDGYNEYEFRVRTENLRHYSYDKWGR